MKTVEETILSPKWVIVHRGEKGKLSPMITYKAMGLRKKYHAKGYNIESSEYTIYDEQQYIVFKFETPEEAMLFKLKEL